jgi:hypothetical protein
MIDRTLHLGNNNTHGKTQQLVMERLLNKILHIVWNLNFTIMQEQIQLKIN